MTLRRRWLERLVWNDLTSRYAIRILGCYVMILFGMLILIFSLFDLSLEGFLISIALIAIGVVSLIWWRFSWKTIAKGLEEPRITKGDEEEIRKYAR